MKQTNQTHTKELEKRDVTKEVLPRLAKKYVNAIHKVTKDGSIYEITFEEEYTIFGQKTRKAKNISSIMWYSRIATEEKEEGKFDFEKWKKFFTESKIVWDGKNIPEYILTQEQIDREAKKLENQKFSEKPKK